MDGIVFAIEMGENYASSRLDRAALFGTGVLSFAAAVLSIALARGPLSTERLATGGGALPRVIALLLVTAAAGPAAWVAYRERRALAERVIAGLALVAAWMLAWRATGTLPRFSFDAWERSLSSTAAGIPWAALVALVGAGAIAATFGLSLHRALVARGAASTVRLRAGVGVASFVLFLLPANAIVDLATGTRFLSFGEREDAWAPAFVGSACPPPAAAPAPAVGAAPSAGPSAAPAR